MKVTLLDLIYVNLARKKLFLNLICENLKFA